MAAYDYGMALARGLIAPQKELQAEVKKLAGDQFKSDDWWNKQLDRQIKEGMREYETATEFKTKSGEYVLGERTQYTTGGYAGVGGTMQTAYTAPKDAVITGYSRGNNWYSPQKPTYDTRSVQVLGPNTKDLTSGQLTAIQTQAEDSAAKVKKEAAQAKKGKRTARGASGLMGRATTKDVGLSAKTPSLGSLGLGIEKTYLG